MLSRQQENPLTEQPSYNRTLGAVRLVSVWALVAALVWWATPTITANRATTTAHGFTSFLMPLKLACLAG